LEWFVYRLRGLAMFELLEIAGRLTVVVAVIFWFMEADNRAKERHYRAWELINSARGSAGDGGRRDALQDLNRDGVSLAAAPLEQAWLPGVYLQGANLAKANLQGATLIDANLQGAAFGESQLMDAALALAGNGTNLQGAYLMGANLQGAIFLTQEQLNVAHGDDQMQLPDGLTRPAHWFIPPAPQPDSDRPAPAASGAPVSDK
jgi:Pentapeptide repeats (8 copies)